MQRTVLEIGVFRSVAQILMERSAEERSLCRSVEDIRLMVSKAESDYLVITSELPPNAMIFADGVTVTFLDGGIACQLLP